MTRNIEIDRLRALAVVATIYAHLPDLWMWNVPILAFLRRYTAGYDGVLLFFTISGFVISASLMPKLEAALNRGCGVVSVLTAFFCKRLYRITPTATLWIFLTLAIVIIVDPPSAKGNLYAALAALFNFFNIYAVLPNTLPNTYGVYWSLSLEEQFYIALPLLLICFRSVRYRLAALAALVTVTEFSESSLSGAFQIPPIVGGVALYIIDQQFNLIKRIRESRLSSQLVLAPLALLLTISIFTIPLIRPFTPHYLLIMGPICTLFVLVAAVGKNAVLPIKGGKAIMEWLGSRSFTLYLSHLPMILIVRYFWMTAAPHFGYHYSQENTLAIFITWIIATIATTELSYRLLEQPLMRRGRNIANNIELRTSNSPWKKGATNTELLQKEEAPQKS
jgi:peptidoglycan/LPS O-acetylase OafA/YrhL